MSTGHSPQKQSVALIAGPTASGKSDLAVRLALEWEKSGGSALIINADSAQVYRDLAVLSARPTKEDMCGIDHVLFGAWDGAMPCSAADWAMKARREIETAHLAGRLPIIVGGTGLYIRTLLDGIAPIPTIDPSVRAKIRNLPVDKAYAALRLEDPERAAQLHPADTTRVARALEVVRATKHTLTYWQSKRTGGISDTINLHPLILLPPRERLYARCDNRFAAMLDHGAVGEVRTLLARKLSPQLPVMKAIGVPEITGWLDGSLSRDEVLAKGAQATRNYAKRQYTWFRKQPPQDWKRVESHNLSISSYFEILFQQHRLT
ncbi:tRNA (adenosine(37)-N6)-dimethylallyltransferase MiaA [Altericroceibacterium spongiae]|uniref:tRNA dimethylallyltransferase n=1 Tax=Altericroceibacterium spongiae TaxID=2320269 RepID=A0A420ECI5_9SPHN|nr:tRNA (adenosine(37)-N6)-dimethylallyltransferase MiaA [Altericroceibacterium spongiae]RKF18385.1 tRNA (adenosine(37)-N6)-dimethylallyltransferase MiaA [Altericroceibacterium spongiae]